MQLITTQQQVNFATYATIGFFDGVHIGHRFLLDALCQQASAQGLKSLVVTFTDSPACILSPNSAVKLLTTPSEKVALLERSGIDCCLMLDFDQNLVRLTAHDFLLQLKENYGVSHLLLGYDHRFGSDGLRSFEDYSALGKDLGIEVQQLTPFDSNGQIVGSRTIRALIGEGYVADAARLLGATYELSGKVEHGNAIGRTIGFPTANLAVSPRKLLPKNGVYAVEVYFGTHSYNSYRGLLNIGTRPTIEAVERTVEVFLFDFSGDLYGQELVVRVLRRIRDEQKFESLEALQAQIEKDKTNW